MFKVKVSNTITNDEVWNSVMKELFETFPNSSDYRIERAENIQHMQRRTVSISDTHGEVLGIYEIECYANEQFDGKANLMPYEVKATQLEGQLEGSL